MMSSLNIGRATSWKDFPYQMMMRSRDALNSLSAIPLSHCARQTIVEAARGSSLAPRSLLRPAEFDSPGRTFAFHFGSRFLGSPEGGPTASWLLGYVVSGSVWN
jgi:hypothetical protein